ncbi:MAG TPA: sulfatase, partial [Actinomycetota bacterium]|nr:sulfatase [Actinomycetota bacterium]
MTTPNVFMLFVDSLRSDAIFGDHVPTPTFDSYAARGAAFREAVCTATTTTPSFSSILTGCYPPKHGVRGLQGYRLSPDVTTIAEAFGSAGYRTYSEVTGPLLPETGVLRGFDEVHHREGYRAPFFGWRDDVLRRMSAYPEPWLMLLHIWEVHRPFRPPPDYTKQWDRAGYEAVVAASDERLEPVLDSLPDNTIVALSGDHGEEYPDGQVEVLLNRVSRKARKVLKPKSWFPYLDRKLSAQAVGHGFALHEHLVRVPLILAGPGISPSTVSDQVRHVDLVPTLADLAGIPIPESVDGRSVRPLMEGGVLPEEPAYMEAVGVKLEGKRIVGARRPDWKLLVPGGGRPALFRLNGGTEPDEKHNLYSRHPEVARELE